MAIVAIMLTYGVVSGIRGIVGLTASSEDGKMEPAKIVLDKKSVRKLLEPVTLANLERKAIRIINDNKEFEVITTLNPDLQTFIHKKLDVKNSRYIGIVTMDPVTGKVLSMVSLDKKNPKGNPCVENQFPAASIFKIIAAAAAIETCDFKENKKLSYNGRNHTLYKSQLKEKINRYTNTITFEKAFAKSVNPVFGKLGYHYLGKGALLKYASGFGFNEPIDFELSLSTSRMPITDKPYNWAEIASGFNQDTTITPLHGALIASVITNGGKLMEPFIIDKIETREGHTVYSGRPTPIKQTVTSETAKTMQNLMKATINSGTLRKSFRGYTRDRVLSKLAIGGKTGSIDTDHHEVRLDWFVGYANEKNGEGRLAISVLVAHEKFIGIRAGQYARMIMKEYFKHYFADKESQDTSKDTKS